MKNKLIIKVLIIFFFSVQNSFSQKWYASLNGGVSFGMNTQKISLIDENTFVKDFVSTSNQNLKSTVIYKSFGEGYNIGVAAGYIFNKNIAIEMGFNHHTANEIGAKSDYNSSNVEIKFKSKTLQFRPSIVLKTDFKKINTYLKFGPLLSFGNIVVSNNFVNVFSPTKEYYQTEYETNKSVTFGVHSSFGLMVGINKNIDVFTEITVINLKYIPRTANYTSYIVDGVQYINDKDYAIPSYEYQESINSEDGSFATPTKVLQIDYPFSSIGFNCGLLYKF